MTIDNIVKHVNENLAGELLTYNELEYFLDQTIDDINATLSSCYPTFSEFTPALYPSRDYNFFPERYIRNVVCKGAAYKYLVMDEEGIDTAQMYGYDYKDECFKMLRDHLENVPALYQQDTQASVIGLSDVAYVRKDRTHNVESLVIGGSQL